MQQCGFCSLVSGLLRRAMCVGSRRGSGESYQASPERDPPKYDSVITELREELLNGRMSLQSKNNRSLTSGLPESDVSLLCTLDMSYDRKFTSGRFLTIHKKKNKHLTTRSLKQEIAMLDDLQNGQVKCILDQSAYWKFNAFTLETVSGGRSLSVLCMHLFHFYGLMKHFDLDAISVWKMFSLIEDGYHSTNPYHNSIHATDVTQAMHCFLQETKICENLEPVEIMASLIGAVAHDVDHPGVNQPFLIATSNHLAALYQNSSVLENHHWRTVIGCVVESGVAEQVKSVWPQLATQISSLILATDITRQKEFLARLQKYMDESNLDLTKEEDRHFILQIALKCADISNPCRPWDISRKWSMKVCEEFFRQGDFERKLNIPITSLCDRHSNSIPKIQTGFLKFVVTPLMNEWHRFLQSDLSFSMIENLKKNQNKWESLAIQELAEEAIIDVSDDDQIDANCDDSPEDLSTSGDLLLPKHIMPEEPVYGDVRRRYSVPATPLKTAMSSIRRDSLPIGQKNSQRKIIFTNEHELNFKDTEFFFNSALSLGIKAEIENTDIVKVENLLAEHSIATITSAQADKLALVLHGTGKKVLRRQMTFPPVMPFTRARYLSAAGEMLSCIENSMEDMGHSNSSGSSQTEIENLIGTKGDAKISNIILRKNETDRANDDSCQSLLKTESTNSLEEKMELSAIMPMNEGNLSPISVYALSPVAPVTIAETELSESVDQVDESDLKTKGDNDSMGGHKHKDIRITENFIDKIRKYDKEAFYLLAKQEPLGRRSSAPVNAVSETNNILTALNNSVKNRNRKKTLLRRSSGGAELIKGYGLMTLDEPNKSIVLYHWSQQASCDLHQKTCETFKRRGSLPV